MPHVKTLLVSFVGTAVAVAVIFRVPFVKKLVIGA